MHCVFRQLIPPSFMSFPSDVFLFKQIIDHIYGLNFRKIIKVDVVSGDTLIAPKFGNTIRSSKKPISSTRSSFQ